MARDIRLPTPRPPYWRGQVGTTRAAAGELRVPGVVVGRGADLVQGGSAASQGRFLPPGGHRLGHPLVDNELGFVDGGALVYGQQVERAHAVACFGQHSAQHLADFVSGAARRESRRPPAPCKGPNAGGRAAPTR